MEEKQRFQIKKKEEWEFFRRLPSFKLKKQEDFEEEFKQKVMIGYSSGSLEGQERYLDEWMVELRQVVLEEDRRLEARERMTMGEEDSSSRRRTEWERIYGAAGTLAILEGVTLNRDARLGIVFCSGKVVSRHAADLRTGLFSGDSLLSAKALWCQSEQLSDMSPWINAGIYRLSKPRPRHNGQAYSAWPLEAVYNAAGYGEFPIWEGDDGPLGRQSRLAISSNGARIHTVERRREAANYSLEIVVEIRREVCRLSWWTKRLQ